MFGDALQVIKQTLILMMRRGRKSYSLNTSDVAFHPGEICNFEGRLHSNLRQGSFEGSEELNDFRYGVN